MKSFKLNLFLFTIWWSIVISSIDDNDIHSVRKVLTTHRETIILKENDLNADKYVVNMTNDAVDYSQDFFYTEDLEKLCHNQVTEFVWKCPTIGDSEEKVLKFRTVYDQIGSSYLNWYLKSINGIDIVELDHKPYNHQILFHVKIYQQTILLSRLYPSYPQISGFEILQFIANLAFQCKFRIEVLDRSDVSTVYTALYGKRYYEYHFDGVDLSQDFLFKKIVVKKKTFLDCFEHIIKSFIKHLSKLFQENIQVCENAFVSVESCPITFDTQRLFYEISFSYCFDWSLIGGFLRVDPPLSQSFEITSKDINRIMTKKKQSNVGFVKINQTLDTKIIKTYDEIKTQIFDTSFLIELFSKIFEFCFVELEKQKFDPNPEDIFKLYLRPCVILSIDLFLKYYTNV